MVLLDVLQKVAETGYVNRNSYNTTNTDIQQEGFSPDPYLTGALIAPTVEGIQSAGVIATTKHYIANEQEHFRQVGESINYGFNITATLSSNIDDKTMHEVYLWPFADAVRAGTGSGKC